MMDNASPFYEGAKVAIVNRHWGFNVLRWATVSRVYKTGRFILDGNKQQYRPDPDGKTAWPTGDNYGHFRKGDAHVERVGTRAAGHLLDGVEHHEFPGGGHG